MSIEISLQEPYLSLLEFSPVCLPDFAVLTGKNGSGKTQLLRAINERKLVVRDLDSEEVLSRISYFPIGAPKIINFPVHMGSVESSIQNSSADSWQLFSKIVSMENHAREYRYQITPQEKRTRIIGELITELGFNPKMLGRLETETGQSIWDVDQTTFRKYYDPLITIPDPFSVNISLTFMSYHSKLVENEYNTFLASKGEDINHLTNDEFMRRYGPPPWNTANSVLKIMELPYNFSVPNSRKKEYTYQAKLVDLKGMEIGLENLSSGEQTSLAIAMSLYAHERWGDYTVFPQLLLFDEIDNTLHPSMIRKLLAILEDILVSEAKCKVIVTTHSPSTVALSSEESIFEMRREGPDRVYKLNSDIAIALLSSGVSTLSVKIRNKRQVFVESGHDEEVYSLIFSTVRHLLEPEISLNFIRAGHQHNGGCAEVTRQVDALIKAGNDSVYGLLDWDLKNVPNGRVKIVGLGERYAIENFIFDPFLLGYYFLKNVRISSSELKLGENIRFTDLIRPSVELAQAVVDGIIHLAQKHRTQEDEIELVECEYENGVCLKIPKWYLIMNGHDLESLWKSIIPALKVFSREPTFKVDVIKHSFKDVDGYIPKALLEALKSVQV